MSVEVVVVIGWAKVAVGWNCCFSLSYENCWLFAVVRLIPTGRYSGFAGTAFPPEEDDDDDSLHDHDATLLVAPNAGLHSVVATTTTIT